MAMIKEKKRKEVEAKATYYQRKIINALGGENASESTKESFRKKLRDGELDDKEMI